MCFLTSVIQPFYIILRYDFFFDQGYSVEEWSVLLPNNKNVTSSIPVVSFLMVLKRTYRV